MAEILNARPLCLAEVAELTKKSENFDSKSTAKYLKSFSKIKIADAKEIMESLRGLNNIKIKESHIVKVVDFMPQDSEGVNKIFSDISLSEDEIQAILQIVKKY